MEHKEIFAVILAALGIILVIGILSMVTKKPSTTEQSSAPEITEAPGPEPVYIETDIWDVLRDQNSTTVTTDTTMPLTPEGTVIYEGTILEGSDLVLNLTDLLTGETEPGVELPAETGFGAETETTTVTEAMTEAPQPLQTYVLQLP